MPKKGDALPPTAGLPLERSMAGILAVLATERDDRLNSPSAPRKTEMVLAGAGLAIGEIAMVTGKSYDAVKKSLLRAKRPPNSKAARRPVQPRQ
jgi:hypothetical protein